MTERAAYLVMVSAGRDYTNREAIRSDFSAVDEEAREEGLPVKLLHGDCKTGGDQIADAEARALGWDVEKHPADWDKHGKAAGPIRNGEMVALRPDILFAYPTAQSRGTWDAVRKARAAGIMVVLGPDSPRRQPS